MSDKFAAISCDDISIELKMSVIFCRELKFPSNKLFMRQCSHTHISRGKMAVARESLDASGLTWNTTNFQIICHLEEVWPTVGT